MTNEEWTNTLNAANSAIAQVGSAVVAGSADKATRKFNAEQADIQRKWAEEQADKANAWNYERWQESNLYNSPVEQMNRLRDAGLNPLFYGLDGNASGAMQDAAQPLGYERANATPFVNPLASGVDTAIKVAQVSNIQSDTAKKNNENLTETQQREKIQAEIENIKQENNNLLAQEGLTNAQKEQIEKNNTWLDRINAATVAEKQANAALDKSQKKRIDDLLEGEKLIQSKTAEDFDRKWKKIDAEIAKMAKETGLLQQDIENYALNHASNGFMGTGLSIQNLFRAGKNVRPRAGQENNFSEGTDISDLIAAGQ